MSNYYGYIYLIKDQKTNKIYIGQCARITQHSINNYYGSGKIIKRIISKRGKYFLKKIILGYCTSQEELNISEICCIEHFQSTNFIYGYNIYDGGYGHKLFGDKNPMYGKKHSLESKIKISQTMINTKVHAGERNGRYKQLTKQQIDDIIYDYTINNLSIHEFIIKHQVGHSVVERILLENNINKRSPGYKRKNDF